MLEILQNSMLVENIVSGTHDDIPAHFPDFAIRLRSVCEGCESWHHVNTELLQLESFLGMYSSIHGNTCTALAGVINNVINYIGNIRKVYSELNRSVPCGYSSVQSEAESIGNTGDSSSESNIAVIEGVELIHVFHKRFFPKKTIVWVRTKLNAFLGMNITDKQMNNNLPNIRRRKNEKGRATFLLGLADFYEDELAKEDCISDLRKK